MLVDALKNYIRSPDEVLKAFAGHEMTIIAVEDGKAECTLIGLVILTVRRDVLAWVLGHEDAGPMEGILDLVAESMTPEELRVAAEAIAADIAAEAHEHPSDN